MRYLNKIEERALQKFNLTGNRGQNISMTLRYAATQESWFADFVYEEKEIKNIRVVKSPNILRGFRKVLPFGILCTSKNGQDPAFIDAFSSQDASLYLLTEDEVAQIESDIYGG